jgi:hypothetical protein
MPGDTVTDCEDGNPCTQEDCTDAGKCAYSPGACDDGNACTNGDHCLNNVCVGWDNNDCIDFDPCTVDKCDSVSGNCTYTPLKGPGCPP